MYLGRRDTQWVQVHISRCWIEGKQTDVSLHVLRGRLREETVDTLPKDRRVEDRHTYIHTGGAQTGRGKGRPGGGQTSGEQRADR